MESTRRNLTPEMSRGFCSHKVIITATCYQKATAYRTVTKLKMTECLNLTWGCPCRRRLMILLSFDVLVVIVNVVLGMSDVKILQDFLIPWIPGHCDTTPGMFKKIQKVVKHDFLWRSLGERQFHRNDTKLFFFNDFAWLFPIPNLAEISQICLNWSKPWEKLRRALIFDFF